MLGFKFTIESLYFTSFRKSTSTSLLSSYKIPPFTTIRGLISNALGLKRDDLYLQDMIKIGIKPYPVEMSSEMTKVLKLKKEGQDPFKRYFPSAPIFKEFLIKPKYDIFIAGDSETINKIHSALKNPQRDLYLGSSDDLVDLEVFDCIEVSNGFGKPCTVVEGLYEDSYLEKIPYKFHKNGRNFSLEEKIISIPNGAINEEMEVFDFYGENIVLI